MLKRCFTTVLVFLLFYFYENIIFSSLSVVSSPEFTFSLLPLLRSSAGSALFSPQEFYDSLTECWDTKHLSGTGKDGGTGLTNRDTKPWRNEEERDGDRQEERVCMCVCVCIYACSQHISVWWPSISLCYLMWFPNLTGSVYLASRGHMVLNVPALPSSAPIWWWWAASHMLNGSQQLCSICSMSVWGWICIFRANKCTSDRGGWNSSPQINQIQYNNPAILEVWRETPDLNSDLHFEPLWSRQRGNLQKHLDPVVKQAEQRSTFPSTAPLPKPPSTQPPFPSNHHPRLFIIGSPTHNQTWKDECSQEPF